MHGHNPGVQKVIPSCQGVMLCASALCNPHHNLQMNFRSELVWGLGGGQARPKFTSDKAWQYMRQNAASTCIRHLPAAGQGHL